LAANVDGTRINKKRCVTTIITMAGMEPFKHSPNSVFTINGKVAGAVNDLSIPGWRFVD